MELTSPAVGPLPLPADQDERRARPGVTPTAVQRERLLQALPISSTSKTAGRSDRTVINSTQDLAAAPLAESHRTQSRARAVNARLSILNGRQGSSLRAQLRRVALPSVTPMAEAHPTLFGDPRVMPWPAPLPDPERRPRLHHRAPRPSEPTARQDYASPDGLRPRPTPLNGSSNARGTTDTGSAADARSRSSTQSHQRLLRPLLTADTHPHPAELRDALATIDHHLTGYITAARLETQPETQDRSQDGQPSFARARSEDTSIVGACC